MFDTDGNCNVSFPSGLLKIISLFPEQIIILQLHIVDFEASIISLRLVIDGNCIVPLPSTLFEITDT